MADKKAETQTALPKKKKTFNRLDERFQLTDAHDPEHIFPEELEMCKELRRLRPELKKETDKFLVTFLCARRHKMDEVLVLLDKYLTKRKELGYDKKKATHRVSNFSLAVLYHNYFLTPSLGI